MSVLELNHVKKSFNNGTLHVLKDISLSVEKGEVVAIIGPSGSGKSTLLRCATLLERIDSGEVCFDGHYAARTGDDGAAVYADKAELKQISFEKRQVQIAIKKATDENSLYYRAAKPYIDSVKTITQSENYSHCEELFALYDEAKARVEQREREEATI